MLADTLGEKDIRDPRRERDGAIGREWQEDRTDGFVDERRVAASTREKSNRAVVIGLIRIVVEPLVQRLPRCRRHDEKQHGQQRGNDCLGSAKGAEAGKTRRHRMQNRVPNRSPYRNLLMQNNCNKWNWSALGESVAPVCEKIYA